MNKKRKIYNSEEWKKIEPLARAHIVLVAEGVKPGATFASFKNISKVLDELGVYYHIKLDTERFAPLKFYTIQISRSQKLIGKVIKLIQAKQPETAETHRFFGKFYGYPACCVTRYFKEASSGNPRRRFILQLLELKKKGKSVPEEFFYLMPTQIPCKPSCKRALQLLRKWREVLQRVDEEAASWLTRWNREQLNEEIAGVERELKLL